MCQLPMPDLVIGLLRVCVDRRGRQVDPRLAGWWVAEAEGEGEGATQVLRGRW